MTSLAQNSTVENWCWIPGFENLGFDWEQVSSDPAGEADWYFIECDPMIQFHSDSTNIHWEECLALSVHKIHSQVLMN